MKAYKHFVVSVAKSAARILSCIAAMQLNSVMMLAAGLMISEGLGILEEILDDRD